jgi:DNA-directed RNA polymerase
MMRFFKEQWEANPGIPLPALPPPGTLDIRQVLDSPYFFA